MDGYIAKLDEICRVAKQYDALVHVDDWQCNRIYW